MRSAGTTQSYYHYDELGSTRLLTNTTGVVTDAYTYDPYGSLLTHNRSTGSVNQPYQYVGRLGYYTHWQSPEFGWLQLGVRFYQADEGRFERRDDVYRPEFSQHSYVNNNPVMLVDPNGKIPLPILLPGGWQLGCAIVGLIQATATGLATPEFPMRDKYIHCIAACRIRRCATIVGSWFFGMLKEYWDHFRGAGFEYEDLMANHEGEVCAKNKCHPTCQKCCASKYKVPTRSALE